MLHEQQIVGIDFGTTFSLVSCLEAGTPIIIHNQEGQNKTPSVVAFTQDKKVLIGEIARRQTSVNPQNTIYSIKRYLGRDRYDLDERGEKPGFVVKENKGRLIIEVGKRNLTPVEIASHIFAKLKDAAEEYLKCEITYAVITVPAYFDDLQRGAVIESARSAGLEVVRLLNEPTAAAMAYGLDKKRDEVIVVYDFGGGTFDISILHVENNTFEVLSSSGDTYLGGDNIDKDLSDFLATDFYEEHHIDLRKDPGIFLRLKESAEVLKCELSSHEVATVTLPFIAHTERGALHFKRKIKRTELEDIIEPYAQRTLECCERAMKDAGLGNRDINEVILVGGSSRIPMVRRYVREFFEKKPITGLNPDEIVAMGAAIQGGVLEGKLQEVVLLDVTPHSLGVETKDNNFSKIIEKNSTIPIKASKMFTTTIHNQQFVHIHILQGASEIASENRSLGKFTLNDIPLKPMGVPRIRVSFFINSDGILHVSAVETSSGIEKELTLSHSFIEDKERKSITEKPESLIGVNNEEKGEEQPFEEVEESRPEEVARSQDEEELAVLLSHEPDSDDQADYPFLDMDDTATDINVENTIKDEIAAQTRITSYHSPLISPDGILKTDDEDIALSDRLRKAVELLNQGDISSRALNLYEDAIYELEELLGEHVEIPALYYLLIKMHLLTHGQRQALELIEGLEKEDSVSIKTAGYLYDTVVRSFPTSLEARKQRATFLLGHEEYENALGDLELLYEKERDSAWLKKIADAYEHILENKPSSSLKFRLVKVYLSLQELDKAIFYLHDLVNLEDYRTQALKILGLCMWQKKLYVKAWQKLKLLPIDDEIADILYRLARDMEDTEQLEAAMQVYRSLGEFNSAYKDVPLRVKKVGYRLKLQEKESMPSLYDLKEPRFVIIEEIARGSMGIIYKARDVVLDEVVVLKVLNEVLLSDESAVKRFKLEARAAKRLSHPHIVRIHDFYETGNKKFISMEYIEGTDLKTMLQREKKLPEERVRKYLLQICDALEYAHSEGIVHRDIKPANIMITKDEKVKITDFGIAKVLKIEDITRAGTAIIGTPLYMAPEQIRGAQVDQRTDIYSLGIVLYEMLTGKPPFFRGNVEYHHVHTEPPPLPDFVSETMRAIIMRCIKKKLDERFPSIRDIYPLLQV